MESNIALVYMTLNMIIILYIYLIYSYYILLITSFNQRSLTGFIFVLVLVRTFVSVVAPSPAPVLKSQDIRIANNTNPSHLSHFSTRINPG
jgi:hypothetical protein